MVKSFDFSPFCCIIVNMDRIQTSAILKDLSKKIVILVGPRQSGKTWLAKEVAKFFPNSVYLNYDQTQDQEIMRAQSWLNTTDLLILDELHKMPNWKNYLKGIFDTKPVNLRILVTGSARLDLYEQLGDSLVGRYFRHRLLPFSLAELRQISVPFDIEKLLLRSGFPEPYLTTDPIDADRWRLQYINSVLSTDVFEIDQLHNLKSMQLLFKLLRNRVGSPISLQSLAEDLAISPTTVKKYIQILEALFIVFRVTPYSTNIVRSLLKEPKLYFFDVGLVQGDYGAKLENLVAISLLKHVYAKEDYQAEQYALHYLRTKEAYEVDFAIIKDNNVEQIIEVKTSDPSPSKGLLYFNNKYKYPAVQLVENLRNDHQQKEIKILNLEKFLADLYM